MKNYINMIYTFHGQSLTNWVKSCFMKDAMDILIN